MESAQASAVSKQTLRLLYISNERAILERQSKIDSTSHYVVMRTLKQVFCSKLKEHRSNEIFL